MIANACHTFSSSFAGLTFFHERAVRSELGRRWIASDSSTRTWIEETATDLGDEYLVLLRKITKKAMAARAKQPVNALLGDLGLDRSSSPEDVRRALAELLAERDPRDVDRASG